MLRATFLVLAMVSLALSGCQRAESSSEEETAAKEAPSAEESGAMAAVAKKVPAKEHGDHEAHAAAKEEGQSCAKGESCGGGCNKWDEAAADVVKRDVPEKSEWQTLKVSGMTCGGCERRVIANIGELDGVLSVEADAELGVVRVATAPGADEPTRLAAARIRELGYSVEIN